VTNMTDAPVLDTTSIPTPIVEMRGLAKVFGTTSVLRGVDLAVNRGEVVVLAGVSGSGKTTLMRCVSLLEEISHGELWFDGSLVEKWEDSEVRLQAGRRQRRLLYDRIGMVFQQYNLFPHLTALENVALAPIHVRREPKASANKRALNLLDRVGLADRADHRPAQLSGGQQQRVAIARALALSPDLLLFDEVTSALDPLMTAEVLRVIRELAEEGTTMIIATHEMGFARHVGTRMVFMADGEIVESGPPVELLTRPRDPRLKWFTEAILSVD
jgi:ABC-type polar amino acid transport system ATPase subunit